MILIDTNILYSIFNEDDDNHKVGMVLIEEILQGGYGKPVILDYVFNELLTLIYIRTKNIKRSTEIGEFIWEFINNKLYDLNFIDDQTFKKAYDIFINQNSSKESKFLSFVDTLIIAHAQHFKIKYIATYEGSFKSFGIEIIGN